MKNNYGIEVAEPAKLPPGGRRTVNKIRAAARGLDEGEALRHPNHRKVTPQGARLLAFIMSEVDAGRPFPDDAAMAAYMGWKNASSARSALMGLAHAGKLRMVARFPSYRGFRYVWEIAPE